MSRAGAPSEPDVELKELQDEAESIAARLRNLGSILPEDLGRVADAGIADEELSQTLVIRVLRVVMKLLALVLGSIRGLFVMAVFLAVANTLLFIAPRLDSTVIVTAGVVLLLPMLLPGLALNLLGMRFAALRESLVVVGDRLTNAGEVPAGLIEAFSGLSDDLDEVTHRRFLGRIVGTARLTREIARIVRGYVDEHRELFDAGMTIAAYGPRDVALTVFGMTGLTVLTLLLPAFLIWALFA